MRQLMSRGLAACAALAMVVLPACGGAEDGNKVASVSGNSATSTSRGKSAETDVRKAFLAFAKCMREHGVNMPDPKFDDQGRALMTQSVGPGGAEKQQAADEACRHLIANAVQNGPKPDPAEEAKMRKQQLAFAKCMRAHGIDMPDPKFNGNGGFSISIGGGANPNNPRFKRAETTCQKQAGLPQMRGPGGAVQFGSGGTQSGKSK
jgi:hypothetical protein